jgi:hypothetical protein
VFARIRDALKRWTLRSREKRAGKTAHDAGERSKELYDRGKTGGIFPN